MYFLLRKRIVKILVFFYLGLFVLFAIGPFEKTLLNVVLASLTLIMFLGPIILGLNLSKFTLRYSFYSLKFNSIYLFLSLAPIASIYATFIYTGKLFESYSNLRLGKSNYFEYYEFLVLNNLTSFSFKKIPAIFSLTFLKFFYYYSLYNYYFIRRSKLSLVAIFVSILSIVHFSIARGTTLEFLDIFLYFILIFILQLKNSEKFNFKKFIVLILTISLSIGIFLNNISLRMQNLNGLESLLNCNTSMCFENNFLPPLLEPIIFKLNGYFSFGLLYLTESIIVLTKTYNLWFLQPLHYTESISSGFLCANGFLNCGVMWVPSALDWILKFSFPMFIFLLIFFGVLTGLLINMFEKYYRFEFLILIYLNFIFFFSLPFSTLFSFSSSNYILYGLSLIWICFISINSKK